MAKSNFEIQRCNSLRLGNYDYSQNGAYFITICTRDRECFLSEITNNVLHLNPFGLVVNNVWKDLPKHYPEIQLDSFVIMPNHVHAVILINSVGAGRRPAHISLSEAIRTFKSISSRQINKVRDNLGYAVWQRGYYDRIIRDDGELNRIRTYIEGNPENWQTDEENPNKGAGFSPAPTRYPWTAGHPQRREG